MYVEVGKLENPWFTDVFYYLSNIYLCVTFLRVFSKKVDFMVKYCKYLPKMWGSREIFVNDLRKTGFSWKNVGNHVNNTIFFLATNDF